MMINEFLKTFEGVISGSYVLQAITNQFWPDSDLDIWLNPITDIEISNLSEALSQMGFYFEKIITFQDPEMNKLPEYVVLRTLEELQTLNNENDPAYQYEHLNRHVKLMIMYKKWGSRDLTLQLIITRNGYLSMIDAFDLNLCQVYYDGYNVYGKNGRAVLDDRVNKIIQEKLSREEKVNENILKDTAKKMSFEYGANNKIITITKLSLQEHSLDEIVKMGKRIVKYSQRGYTFDFTNLHNELQSLINKYIFISDNGDLLERIFNNVDQYYTYTHNPLYLFIRLWNNIFAQYDRGVLYPKYKNMPYFHSYSPVNEENEEEVPEYLKQECYLNYKITPNQTFIRSDGKEVPINVVKYVKLAFGGFKYRDKRYDNKNKDTIVYMAVLTNDIEQPVDDMGFIMGGIVSVEDIEYRNKFKYILQAESLVKLSEEKQNLNVVDVIDVVGQMEPLVEYEISPFLEESITRSNTIEDILQEIKEYRNLIDNEEQTLIRLRQKLARRRLPKTFRKFVIVKNRYVHLVNRLNTELILQLIALGYKARDENTIPYQVKQDLIVDV